MENPNPVPAEDTPSKEAIKTLLADRILSDLLSERQSERRWRWVKRFAFSATSLGLFALYLFFYASSLGYRLIPNSEVVAIVNVSGPIGAGELASAVERPA